MEQPDDWRRHLECVICLNFTPRGLPAGARARPLCASQPVRLWHQPPLHQDCGVVLCPPCAEHWRQKLIGDAVCPRCRRRFLFF